MKHRDYLGYEELMRQAQRGLGESMPMEGRQAVLGIADMNASVMHIYAYTKLTNDVRQTMTSLLDQTHIFA